MGRARVAIERRGRTSVRSTAKVVQFSECVVDKLCGKSSKTDVAVSFQQQPAQNQVILASENLDDTFSPTVLSHPSFCPIRRAAERGTAVTDNNDTGVGVAACALLQSADGRLLLTRRARTMRAFPGVWVSPGGYVDDGETVEEAALRELGEETGLHGLPLTSPGRTLLLWESVYPPVLEAGQPLRHCLVAYVHFRTSLPSSQLHNFRISPAEVDAVAWLSLSEASQVVAGACAADAMIKIMTKVGAADSTTLQEVEHPLSLLCQQLDVDAFEKSESTQPLERVSTGTRVGLQRLLLVDAASVK